MNINTNIHVDITRGMMATALAVSPCKPHGLVLVLCGKLVLLFQYALFYRRVISCMKIDINTPQSFSFIVYDTRYTAV
jgi:hypothetical protein